MPSALSRKLATQQDWDPGSFGGAPDGSCFEGSKVKPYLQPTWVPQARRRCDPELGVPRGGSSTPRLASTPRLGVGAAGEEALVHPDLALPAEALLRRSWSRGAPGATPRATREGSRGGEVLMAREEADAWVANEVQRRAGVRLLLQDPEGARDARARRDVDIASSVDSFSERTTTASVTPRASAPSKQGRRDNFVKFERDDAADRATPRSALNMEAPTSFRDACDDALNGGDFKGPASLMTSECGTPRETPREPITAPAPASVGKPKRKPRGKRMCPSNPASHSLFGHVINGAELATPSYEAWQAVYEGMAGCSTTMQHHRQGIRQYRTEHHGSELHRVVFRASPSPRVSEPGSPQSTEVYRSMYRAPPNETDERRDYRQMYNFGSSGIGAAVFGEHGDPLRDAESGRGPGRRMPRQGQPHETAGAQSFFEQAHARELGPNRGRTTPPASGIVEALTRDEDGPPVSPRRTDRVPFRPCQRYLEGPSCEPAMAGSPSWKVYKSRNTYGVRHEWYPSPQAQEALIWPDQDLSESATPRKPTGMEGVTAGQPGRIQTGDKAWSGWTAVTPECRHKRLVHPVPPPRNGVEHVAGFSLGPAAPVVPLPGPDSVGTAAASTPRSSTPRTARAAGSPPPAARHRWDPSRARSTTPTPASTAEKWDARQMSAILSEQWPGGDKRPMRRKVTPLRDQSSAFKVIFGER